MKRDVLIVDDEASIRREITTILQSVGLSTREASNRVDCMAEVNFSPPALVILDLWLAGENKREGLDILKELKQDDPRIPVIIMTGHGNMDIANSAMKLGAHDYIEKPFRRVPLLIVTKRALETSKLRRENAALRVGRESEHRLVGSTPAFLALKSSLEKVATTNCRVLLDGPAGSGKEACARFIHASSPRSDAPFVSVNCRVAEHELLEEYIFGSEVDGRITRGMLEKGHRGVVYFDEVAGLDKTVQAKLLRAIVNNVFQRVNGSSQVRAEFKAISGTSRNLVKECKAGRFRKDLYHRLSVVMIEVPGLEVRSADIPDLAEYFIEDLHRREGLPRRKLSEDAKLTLAAMQWPGNVRQLKNAMERVLILSRDDSEIGPEELEEGAAVRSGDERPSLPAYWLSMPIREARENFEREYFITQVNRFSGNISETAKHVGMERSALHRRLKTLRVVTANSFGTRLASVGRKTS